MNSHPLHDAAFIKQYNDAHREMRLRHTGRSTRQALKYIALAMEQVGCPIRVRDHHGTYLADRELLNTIHQMIGKLGFKHFTLNSTQLTLTFGSRI